MIRKIPLIIAGMAAPALAVLSLQGAAAVAAPGSGAIWQIVPSPNPGTFPTLLAVAASSASDAWTVGYYANSTNSTYFSLAEHWNGRAWAVVPTPNPFGTENILNAVADLTPAHAWAVGYRLERRSRRHRQQRRRRRPRWCRSRICDGCVGCWQPLRHRHRRR